MIYFDTSVIMAMLVPSHENHEEALHVFYTIPPNSKIATTKLHSYAELYNNLTRQGNGHPGLPPAILPDLLDNLGETFEMIELDKKDYLKAVQRCATLSLTRAIIYDALHYQAAVKAGANILFTDNLRDFTRLQLPEDELVVKGIRK